MKRIGIGGCAALLLLLAACGNQGKSQMSTKSNAYNPLSVSSVGTDLPVNMHAVKNNESIYDIAQQYHVDVGELLRLNPDLAGRIGINPNAGNGMNAGTGAPQGAIESPIDQGQTVKLPSNDKLGGYEQQVLALTNEERKKAGLSPCAGSDANLNRSAKAKSEDMAAKNYFAHDSPTYGDPFAMMRNFGVQYQSAGENIAMGQPTPQEVVTAWMNSPGHRANILKPEFNYLGVGYVLKNGKAYWTQQFIGK